MEFWQAIYKMKEMEDSYKEKLDKYILECEKERKEYSLEQLLNLNELELLNIMPPNKIINTYNEAMGKEVIKHIVTFKAFKTIDHQWDLEYSEGHRDKPLKDQYILFELRCKDLKTGLIDMFLRAQNYTNEYWNGIKSGRIKIDL